MNATSADAAIPSQAPKDTSWDACWAFASQINGWLTKGEGRLLYDTARALPKGASIVEIGSFFGRSTVCLGYGSLAGASSSSASPTRIFAIDPHIGSPKHEAMLGCSDTYPYFVDNIAAAGIADLVTPIHKRSTEAGSDVDGDIDFLFIDGSHERADVQDDFEHWFPRVVAGGGVAFHDSWHMAGVRQVSDAVLRDCEQVCDPRLVDTITILRKVEERDQAQRRASRRFRAARRWRGLGGFLRLTYRGTRLTDARAQPGARARQR